MNDSVDEPYMIGPIADQLSPMKKCNIDACGYASKTGGLAEHLEEHLGIGPNDYCFRLSGKAKDDGYTICDICRIKFSNRHLPSHCRSSMHRRACKDQVT